jgi:hypothetical protein
VPKKAGKPRAKPAALPEPGQTQPAVDGLLATPRGRNAKERAVAKLRADQLGGPIPVLERKTDRGWVTGANRATQAMKSEEELYNIYVQSVIRVVVDYVRTHGEEIQGRISKNPTQRQADRLRIVAEIYRTLTRHVSQLRDLLHPWERRRILNTILNTHLNETTGIYERHGLKPSGRSIILQALDAWLPMSKQFQSDDDAFAAASVNITAVIENSQNLSQDLRGFEDELAPERGDLSEADPDIFLPEIDPEYGNVGPDGQPVPEIVLDARRKREEEEQEEVASSLSEGVVPPPAPFLDPKEHRSYRVDATVVDSDTESIPDSYQDFVQSQEYVNPDLRRAKEEDVPRVLSEEEDISLGSSESLPILSSSPDEVVDEIDDVTMSQIHRFPVIGDRVDLPSRLEYARNLFQWYNYAYRTIHDARHYLGTTQEIPYTRYFVAVEVSKRILQNTPKNLRDWLDRNNIASYQRWKDIVFESDTDGGQLERDFRWVLNWRTSQSSRYITGIPRDLLDRSIGSSPQSDFQYIRRLLQSEGPEPIIPWLETDVPFEKLNRMILNIQNDKRHPLHPKTPQQMRLLQQLIHWRTMLQKNYFSKPADQRGSFFKMMDWDFDYRDTLPSYNPFKTMKPYERQKTFEYMYGIDFPDQTDVTQRDQQLKRVRREKPGADAFERLGISKDGRSTIPPKNRNWREMPEYASYLPPPDGSTSSSSGGPQYVLPRPDVNDIERLRPFVKDAFLPSDDTVLQNRRETFSKEYTDKMEKMRKARLNKLRQLVPRVLAEQNTPPVEETEMLDEQPQDGAPPPPQPTTTTTATTTTTGRRKRDYTFATPNVTTRSGGTLRVAMLKSIQNARGTLQRFQESMYSARIRALRFGEHQNDQVYLLYSGQMTQAMEDKVSEYADLLQRYIREVTSGNPTDARRQQITLFYLRAQRTYQQKLEEVERKYKEGFLSFYPPGEIPGFQPTEQEKREHHEVWFNLSTPEDDELRSTQVSSSSQQQSQPPQGDEGEEEEEEDDDDDEDEKKGGGDDDEDDDNDRGGGGGLLLTTTAPEDSGEGGRSLMVVGREPRPDVDNNNDDDTAMFRDVYKSMTGDTTTTTNQDEESNLFQIGKSEKKNMSKNRTIVGVIDVERDAKDKRRVRFEENQKKQGEAQLQKKRQFGKAWDALRTEFEKAQKEWEEQNKLRTEFKSLESEFMRSLQALQEEIKKLEQEKQKFREEVQRTQYALKIRDIQAQQRREQEDFERQRQYFFKQIEMYRNMQQELYQTYRLATQRMGAPPPEMQGLFQFRPIPAPQTIVNQNFYQTVYNNYGSVVTTNNNMLPPSPPVAPTVTTTATASSGMTASEMTAMGIQPKKQRGNFEESPDALKRRAELFQRLVVEYWTNESVAQARRLGYTRPFYDMLRVVQKELKKRNWSDDLRPEEQLWAWHVVLRDPNNPTADRVFDFVSEDGRQTLRFGTNHVRAIEKSFREGRVFNMQLISMVPVDDGTATAGGGSGPPPPSGGGGGILNALGGRGGGKGGKGKGGVVDAIGKGGGPPPPPPPPPSGGGGGDGSGSGDGGGVPMVTDGADGGAPPPVTDIDALMEELDTTDDTAPRADIARDRLDPARARKRMFGLFRDVYVQSGIYRPCNRFR